MEAFILKENPQPHILRLFLDSPLDVALTKFQAMNNLGRSFAGLLVFIEGLRKLNIINEVVYQYYRERYMKPLQTTPIVEDLCIAKQKEEEFEKARKQLQNAIELFPKLKASAQQHWRKYALDHPEVPESIELLKKYDEVMKT
jgi:tetratricopeptide (TPR) repeat protein